MQYCAIRVRALLTTFDALLISTQMFLATVACIGARKVTIMAGKAQSCRFRAGEMHATQGGILTAFPFALWVPYMSSKVQRAERTETFDGTRGMIVHGTTGSGT